VKAKKYGTKTERPIGRLTRTLPKDFIKYYKRWKHKKIKGTEFAKLIDVSRSTLYRHIKEYESLS
jgi:transcriptional regulator of acetoin/glycerol metabolism